MKAKSISITWVNIGSNFKQRSGERNLPSKYLTQLRNESAVAGFNMKLLWQGDVCFYFEGNHFFLQFMWGKTQVIRLAAVVFNAISLSMLDNNWFILVFKHLMEE